MAAVSGKARTRFSGAERKQQMIDAADRIVNRDRTADLSMREVADMAGASRALAYAYFPDRIALLNALLQRQVDQLTESGIGDAAGQAGLVARSCAVAGLYLRHVVEHGEALGLVMREAVVARQLDGAVARLRGRVYRALARQARHDLHMPAVEAMALVQLLAVIPEEAARHVRKGVLTLEEGLALSNRMMSAALAAQVPR